MAAPSSVISSIKDRLRIPATDTSFNSRLEAAYERALSELARETDLFASIQQIPTVVGQAKYTVAAGTTRVLAVIHNGEVLFLVPSRSLDLLTSWQTDGPGTPEEWTMDKLPSAGPLDFALHPAPAVAGSGDAGLTVIREGKPANDNPPAHFYPFLIYKTAAIFSLESTEERDPRAGEIWNALADVWRELLTV